MGDVETEWWYGGGGGLNQRRLAVRPRRELTRAKTPSEPFANQLSQMRPPGDVAPTIAIEHVTARSVSLRRGEHGKRGANVVGPDGKTRDDHIEPVFGVN